MKTSNIIAIAALSMLAAVGAQAETYDGVLQINSARTRAEVSTEGSTIARAGNVYGEVAQAGPTSVQGTALDRSAVRAEAYASAHAPNQNLDRKAFVNSVIPTQYTNGSLKIRTVRQAAL